MAREDPRVRLIRQENAGTAAARNTGIANARGELIGFCDNDDIWTPRYAEEVDRRFRSDPAIGLVYTDAWPFQDESKRVHRLTSLEDYPPVDPDASEREFLLALLRLNFLIASSVTVSRDALDRVGGFRPELSGSDDWDMWLRIAAAGFRGVRAGDRPLVLLRNSPTSQSKNDLQMYERGLLTAQSALQRAEDDPEARAIAAEVVAQYEHEAAMARSPSATRRLRRSLGRIRAQVVDRWRWREPPGELLDAYPAFRDA
jgi:glycosyltransferase involved in cell wall biosynthesis